MTERADSISWLRSLFAERLPKGVGWPHVLGSVALALFLVQGVTGAVLALYYSPTPENAWESVRYVDSQVTMGRWLRGLHHWGASATVVILLLHMTQVFLWGGHKGRRRVTWWIGATLLLVVLAFGFTGYLLPWDMKAYFGTKVGVQIASSAPVAGAAMGRWLQGGEAIGELTLTRFYALHAVLLPLAAVLLVGLHLAWIRRLGVSAPGVAEGQPHEDGPPFFPGQALRDSVAVLVAVAAVSALSFARGAPLEGRADPTNTDYVPHPEWYFLGLQHLLRILPVFWATTGVPTIAVLLLFLAPVLDRSPHRAFAKRPVAIACWLAILTGAIWLTWAGSRALDAERVRRAAREPVAREARPVEPVSSPERIARGKELYASMRCASCHEAPDAGQGVDLPPALRFAGSKFRREWLVDYLIAPSPIRWYREGVRPETVMPDFKLDREKAECLTDYLLSLRDESRIPKTGIQWSVEVAGASAQGEALYRQYTCHGCHRIAGEGRDIGPDLTTVGGRLLEDYMFALARKPQRIVPKTPMKDNGLWDEDAEAIVRYLRNLR